jgi:hypothetical protein
MILKESGFGNLLFMCGRSKTLKFTKMANKIFNFPVSEMKIFEIDHGSH